MPNMLSSWNKIIIIVIIIIKRLYFDIFWMIVLYF